MADGMKASEVLSRAADLIERPGAWTQHVMARTRDGRSLGIIGAREDAEAVCFCAIGSIIRSDPTGGVQGVARDFLHAHLGSDSIADWNDAPSRTQSEVVTALRQASELARSEGN